MGLDVLWVPIHMPCQLNVTKDSTKIEPCHRGPLQGFLGDSPEFVPKGSVSVGELCLVVFIDTEITADDLRFGDLSKYLRV